MENTGDDLKVLSPDTLDTGIQRSSSTSVVAYPQNPDPPTAIGGTPTQLDIGLSALDSSTPTLQEFTVFPNLPLELRRLIWGHSLPGPRIIEIFTAINDLRYIRPQTHTLLFAVSRACKESEEVVSNKYKKTTADDWLLNGLPSNSAVLFNYQQDVVHLTDGCFIRQFLSSAPKSIIDDMTTIGFNTFGLYNNVKEYCMFDPTPTDRQSATLSKLFRLPKLKRIFVQPDLERYPRTRAPFKIVDCRGRLPCFRTLKTIESFKRIIHQDDFLTCLKAVDVEIGSYVRQDYA